MARNLQSDTRALWVAGSETQQIKRIVGGVTQHGWPLQHATEDPSESFQEILSNSVHRNLPNLLVLLVEKIRYGVNRVEFVVPIGGAKDEIEPLPPRVGDLRRSRQQPIHTHSQRKEQPQINCLRSRDRLDGSPLDLHPIWI